MKREHLFKKEVDNYGLVVFRIFFGLLMWVESWGAIATGWVSRAFVEPQFVFSFLGFEWTAFLLGETMYVYYFIMGIFGIGIMLGYRYTASCIGFFVFWTLCYFMQKTHYNNHYYLVVLVSGIMIFMPAHAHTSFDAKYKKVIQTIKIENWKIWAFKLQIALVYFYGAIAKLYPGWYENRFISIRMQRSAQYFTQEWNIDFMSGLLLNKPFQYFLTYSGIGFDFLIIPMLLWKKTRKIAFFGLLFFHIFNSIVLQIGIFPYFALAFAVFYFPTETIRKIFFKGRNIPSTVKNTIKNKSILRYAFMAYFIIQIALPLRHLYIPENVLWTEEGHRMSWRMMLRTKSSLGLAQVKVVIPETGKTEYIHVFDYLTPKQAYSMSTKPDLIWQFSQYLEKEYQKKGIADIEVYVSTRVAVNNQGFYPLVDTEIDLTSVKWNYFGHQSWITKTPDIYK